jgi:hypothetical protein
MRLSWVRRIALALVNLALLVVAIGAEMASTGGGWPP